MSLSEIHDLSKSYLVNDTCFVEAKVSIRKGDNKILDQESGELQDFKGLGLIELQRPVKDLTADGIEHLQMLWDELIKSFKFDLRWLQPHVQSVFGMKNMTARVYRMREDVNILENEINRRRAMLAAAERKKIW
ncbi:hypothetical protein ACLB2K_073502 [Fragaria x ananassa]